MAHAPGDDWMVDHIPETPRNHLILLLERDERILELRRAGMTYEGIAKALRKDEKAPINVSADVVAGVVRKRLREAAESIAESSDELRQLELDRLDAMLVPMLRQARAGNEKSATIVLRIMQRRAKLTGLDAAIKVEHSGTMQMLHDLGTSPEELAREQESFITGFAVEEIEAPDDALEADVAALIEAAPEPSE